MMRSSSTAPRLLGSVMLAPGGECSGQVCTGAFWRLRAVAAGARLQTSRRDLSAAARGKLAAGALSARQVLQCSASALHDQPRPLAGHAARPRASLALARLAARG